MKKNVVFTFIFMVFIVSFYSCKSGKTSKNKSIGEISYNALKLFNQSYFEGAKQKSLGNYDKAIIEFKNALDILPEHHECMYQLGSIYLKLNKFEDAEYWSEKALGINKNYNFWYYEQLGRIYIKSNKFEKAASVYSKIIEKEPSRKEIYEKAADAYVQVAKYNDATIFLNKYINKFGHDEDICRKLERIYLSNNQINEAYKIIKLLSETYPGNIKYLSLLAELQVKNKYYNEARFTYYKILKL